jgi:solute carrier family 8 (sodium/calcium exchanger)
MSYTTWGKQFRDAMNVDGGNLDDATTLDYIMHFFTFGWKVMLFEKKTVVYFINC